MKHLKNPYSPAGQGYIEANRGDHVHNYVNKSPVYEDLIDGKVLLGWKYKCDACTAYYIDGLTIPQVIKD